MLKKKNNFILVIPLLGAVILWTSLPASANLITNWSFEEPDVDTGARGLFTNFNVSGWGVLPASETPDGWGDGVYLEIQDHWEETWDAYEGIQFAEIDAGLNSSSVYQDISTIPDQSYTLQFTFSPRPRQGVLDNTLGIMWDGVIVDTLSADGGGLDSTLWTLHNYTLTASSNTTRLIFGDIGQHDSAGIFIDAVIVEAVPVPAAVWLFGSGLLGLIGLARRNA